MGNQETLNCSRCKATKIITRLDHPWLAAWVATVADKMRLSGYKPVMLTDTSIIWFCPSCVAALRPHILAIVEAAGEDSSVYWPNMVGLLDLKPGRKENS